MVVLKAQHYFSKESLCRIWIYIMCVLYSMQCQMLESELNSDVLAMCLKNPQDALAIINGHTIV